MTIQNETDLKLYKGFYQCRCCGYSAPPALVKTKRKHFDAHSYQCTRCLFKTETKENQDQALSAWNTPAAQPQPPVDLNERQQLIEIVEGLKGSMEHGTWRDEHGKRLKDAPEWVKFYNASRGMIGNATDKSAKLDIHILLDALADAARGEPLDPEICQTIERIAKDHAATDFTENDIQALYDCGPMQPTEDAQRALNRIDDLTESICSMIQPKGSWNVQAMRRNVTAACAEIDDIVKVALSKSGAK